MKFNKMKMKYCFSCLALFLLFLIACNLSFSPASVANPIPTTPVTSTPEPSHTKTPQPTPLPASTMTPPWHAQRVIILSMDGLRPDAIELAPMPNLLELMKTSAYTLSARTIYPSSTLPAHASMLTGLCPSKHGVDWNDYIPAKGVAHGIDLFDLAHGTGMETLMYVGKEKLRQVTDSVSVDQFVYINDRDKVIMQKLLANFPEDFGMLFIHFATTDDMGDVYGWLSPEQFSVIFRADEAIGDLLSALDARGLRKETLLIITADHGGHGTTHGTSMPEDMTIPWIASGPGIKAGKLQTQVHTMDTAATAAYALGLSISDEWDGVPVYEAFGLLVERLSKDCGK